ncbi:MAG: radical SAM protein [Deltaproteobacteria bacterium]|nr:radical SAM protein [Deltaproteobacteria bacterium]
MATREDSRRLVRFRFRLDRGAPTVEVRGEMQHWLYPAQLEAAGDGWGERGYRLPPGAYQYKFRRGDDWLLDPDNPRTRSRDGARNSLLVVDGAGEPVLHAPARPFVFEEDDGRICVRAGLRAPEGGAALELRWDEGAGVRRQAMRVVAREDEHVFLEAHVPGTGRYLEYLFALADGTLAGTAGGAAQAFRVAREDLRLRTPAWWREAVLYTIFVDRFRRGGEGGAWPATPTDRDTRAGGDLAGIVEAIPYLADLGVTVLHLTPICASPSVHRYDAIDPRAVAPELGDDDALARLFDAAHGAGLRVLLDVAVTHVHRDFAPFRDVRERGRESPYASWFHLHHHPFFEGYDPGYAHYQKGQWQEPLLRVEEPEVVAYLCDTFVHWAKRGADGFRIDAAADVPREVVRKIARAVRAVRADAALFAEYTPDNIAHWTCDGVDAATDFVAQQAVYDWLWRRTDGGAARVAEVHAQRRVDRGGPGWTAIAFTATHDQPRLRTLVQDPQVARLGQLHTLLRAAVPALYYGDEVGLCSDEPARAFEDSWPDRQCMPWDPASWDTATLDLVRAAIRLRRTRPALSRGDEQELPTTLPGVVAFRRTCGDDVVDVYLNGSAVSRTVALAPCEASGARTLLALGEASLDHQEVTLGPWAGIAVARVRELPEDALGDDEAVAHNRLIGALAYARGATECPAYPAHLYVTITEACNLRCRHCITHAPELTQAGRARAIRPWVIEALRPALAAADYVVFAHGGESLVARELWDVLAAIRAARAGRATAVHLLSNGMLLLADTTRRLVDAGVTSLMVSLDGATAATNDHIRAGGRIATVAANLRDAVRVRRELGADLRIGISTVAGATNVHELADVARLAVDLGVDWLKVEETYPATPFARRDLLPPRAVADRMGAVRDVLAGTAVVLVDHVDPPHGCRCEAPDRPAAEAEALLAFRRADDFANRTTFSPCRAAWEQACVDPDGTVHPIDYFHPALGNLADTPFLDLWNHPLAQRLRARALARIAPERRARCAGAS